MKKIILSAATAGALALFATVGPIQAQQSNNNQLLFGVTFFQNQLITIDTTTGEGTLVGSIGENVSGYGLAPYQGKLYTFNSHDNTIDQLPQRRVQLVEGVHEAAHDHDGIDARRTAGPGARVQHEVARGRMDTVPGDRSGTPNQPTATGQTSRSVGSMETISGAW